MHAGLASLVESSLIQYLTLTLFSHSPLQFAKHLCILYCSMSDTKKMWPRNKWPMPLHAACRRLNQDFDSSSYLLPLGTVLTMAECLQCCEGTCLQKKSSAKPCWGRGRGQSTLCIRSKQWFLFLHLKNYVEFNSWTKEACNEF